MMLNIKRLGVILIFTFLLCENTFAFSGPGTGTSLDPFLINNCVQLSEMQDDLGAAYRINDYIDCSDTQNWDSLAGWTPIGSSMTPFTGSLEGDGNTIEALTIDREGGDYQGLFGVISGATISDFIVSGPHITGNNFAGVVAGSASSSIVTAVSVNNLILDAVTSVGGLLGYSERLTTVSSSSVSGTIDGSEGVGGLVGDASMTTIQNSASHAAVTGLNIVGGVAGSIVGNGVSNRSYIVRSYADGPIEATGGTVGGLVGDLNAHTTVQNCYTRGNVTGGDVAGGIIGSMSALATLYTCYSTGTVTGTDVTAPIVASFAYGDDMFLANLWDETSSGIHEEGFEFEGTGTSTYAMKDSVTFTDAGWDFDDVWAINNFTLSNANDNYPFFKWQSITPINFRASVVSGAVKSGTLQTDSAVITGSMDVDDSWDWDAIDALPDSILFFHLMYGTSSYPDYIHGGLFPTGLNLHTYYPYYANDMTPDAEKPDLNEIETEMTASSLVCNTTYYYRVLGGLSRYPRSVTFFGDEETFTTPDCPVASTPSTNRSGSRSSGSGVTVENKKEEVVQVFTDPLLPVRNLFVGLSGDDVKKLQDILIKLNLGKGAQNLKEVGITGYFGVLTRSALAEYQKANGITPSYGYFGPITRDYMRAKGQSGIWWK